MREVSRLLSSPFRALRGGSRVLTAAVDDSDVSRSPGAVAIRRLLAALFIAYATLLAVQSLRRGQLPSVAHLFLAMFGVALLGNFGARFIRDWALVLAGVFSYVLAGRYAQGLHLPVHYAPQIDADRVFGLGSIPSVWLQKELYHGHTGPLEVFSTVMYASHFFAPLLLAFYIWFRRMNRAFLELMFAILATSVLADITFVLFPTAPPWLATQHGHLSGVHHILRQTLFDLHLSDLGSVIGNSHKYNIVAALPSMHVAFPVIALLVAIRHRLPRYVVSLQALQLLGVLFAIVYLGDHYVVDAVAGALYGCLGLAVVRRLLALPRRDRQALAHVTPLPEVATIPSEPRPVVANARS